MEIAFVWEFETLSNHKFVADTRVTDLRTKKNPISTKANGVFLL